MIKEIKDYKGTIPYNPYSFIWEGDYVFEVGERVRWRSSLDADYSYGTIIYIGKKWATVRGCGYYDRHEELVHLRHIEKIDSGGKHFGGNKKHSKRSFT